MKVIPHCGVCEPDSDPKLLMGDAPEVVCAHCGAIVRRHRQWKHDGPGILVAGDVFVCTPPGEQPATTLA